MDQRRTSDQGSKTDPLQSQAAPLNRPSASFDVLRVSHYLQKHKHASENEEAQTNAKAPEEDRAQSSNQNEQAQNDNTVKSRFDDDLQYQRGTIENKILNLQREILEIHRDDMKINLKRKKWFFRFIVCLTIGCSGFILLLAIASMRWIDHRIPDTPLTALFSTAFVAVLGLPLVVARNLFPSKSVLDDVVNTLAKRAKQEQS